MRYAVAALVGGVLGLLAAWLTGCTVTLSATEKGAVVGLTFDPSGVIATVVRDGDKEKRR